MPRWRVDTIRKRAEHLGTVEAANANEAIKIAAKEFDIPPEQQNRTVVLRHRGCSRALWLPGIGGPSRATVKLHFEH